MTRLLITGVSGFLGSHLAVALSKRYELFGASGKCASSPLSNTSRLNLANPEEVREFVDSVSPQIVLHCAAMSRVLACEASPGLAHAVNARSTGVIAEWCDSHHARLIYLSSDQVFSGTRGYYEELDTPGPINIYGRTKLDAERLALSLCRRSVIVRSNSIVGRSLGWGESFTDWVRNCSESQTPKDLYGDQFRSPVHVRDMITVVELLCENEFVGVLHVGGPERLSRLETAQILLRAMDTDMGVFSSASYRTHPDSAIMPADTSYRLRDVLTIFPELSSRDIGSRLEDEARAQVQA